MSDGRDGQSAGGKTFARDLWELITLEIALARAEVKAKARNAAIGGALLVIAAVDGLFLIAALVTAVILAVALAVPGWAAALVVAGFLAIVALVAMVIGISLLRRSVPPLPRQAIETSKENVEWLITRLRSVRE
jgi:hypothetical protein